MRMRLAVLAVIAALSLLQARGALASDRDYPPGGDQGRAMRNEVELGEDPSLEDYLAYAASNDPGLAAAFMEWQAALSSLPHASSLPDPVFTWGYYIENVETRVGPQRQRFALRQSFPWFGTLSAREGVAAAEAQAAFQNLQDKRLRLFYEVARSYCDYYLLGRRIDITSATIDIYGSWERIARARYASGHEDFVTLSMIEIEVARLEDRLSSLEDSRRSAEESLRSLVGFPDSFEPPFPGALPLIEPLSADSAVARVESGNPGLKALDRLVERNEEAARLAGKLSLPDLTLGFDWIDTGEALDPMMPESGKDPWMVSLSVKIPIWFAGNRSAREAAGARLAMSRYRLADRRQALRARAERALFEYRDSARKVGLYEDELIPRALEAGEVSLRAYESGKVGFLSVLEAQRLLLDLRLEMEEASVARAIRAAELMMLSGRDSTNWIERKDAE